MAIQIRYAKESDSHALGLMNIACFRDHISFPHLFPSIPEAQVLPLKQSRALEKLAAPQVHVLTAVDTADRPVGYARWTIPGEANPHTVKLSDEGQAMVTNQKDLMPEGMRNDIYELFFRKIKEARQLYVKEDDMVLDLLATLPEAQGKGVGTKMLRWGTELADERNARIFLEATQEGYPLYCKFGWKPLGEIVIDFEEFGGQGTATYVLMMRERKTTRASEGLS